MTTSLTSIQDILEKIKLNEDINTLSQQELLVYLAFYPIKIEQVINPSLELQVIAVTADPKAILKINKPHLITQHIAYSKNAPELLGSVPNADLELTKKYLRQYPNKITNFKNPHVELQIEAIRYNPSLIEDIQNPAIEACELALKINYKLLGLIKNQTIDLCIYALEEEYKDVAIDDFCKLFKEVKIVKNPNHETTLNNLKKRKEIMKLN